MTVRVLEHGSKLGWFDQCSGLSFNPKACSVGFGRFGQVGRGCVFASSWIVQVGVPLASELGCPVLLVAFNPKAWQICNVATLPGDSFAWQQVGNLRCQCSMGRLASLKC